MPEGARAAVPTGGGAETLEPDYPTTHEHSRLVPGMVFHSQRIGRG
jgi:hypothetical protein